MHPERRRQFIDAYLRRQERGRVLGRRLASLTERERTVLDRLAKGQRAQSIADECVVSVTTVRTQIRAIFGKLEVGSQLEAVVLLNEYQRRRRCDNVVLTTLSDLAAARCRAASVLDLAADPGPVRSGRQRAHAVGRSGSRRQRSCCLRRTEDGPYGRNDDEIDSDGMVRSGTSASKWATGVTLADAHRRPSRVATECDARRRHEWAAGSSRAGRLVRHGSTTGGIAAQLDRGLRNHLDTPRG